MPFVKAVETTGRDVYISAARVVYVAHWTEAVKVQLDTGETLYLQGMSNDEMEDFAACVALSPDELVAYFGSKMATPEAPHA